MDGSKLVTCMHMYLDMRSDDEKKTSPLTGVMQGLQEMYSTEPLKPIQQSPATSQQVPQPNLSKDGSTSQLNIIRSMINLQREPAGSIAEAHSTFPQDGNALLQQLQLKNLQDQLQSQIQVNHKQQIEYDNLKDKLAKLDPLEIDNLKQTVNELMAVQKAKAVEHEMEIQHQQKEKQLYQQLYQSLQLPWGNVASGILGAQTPFAVPAPAILPQNLMMPPLMPAINRLPDVQFLAQVGSALKPQAETQVEGDTTAAMSEPVPSLMNSASSLPVENPVENPVPADIPASVSPADLAVPESVPVATAASAPNSAPAPAAVTVAQVDPPQVNTTASDSNQETAAQIAGEYAEKMEPLQYPNPKQPLEQYGSGLPDDPNKKSAPAVSAAQNNATAETPEVAPAVPEPQVLEQQDDDLPDVSKVIPSTPKFADDNFGISFVMDHLDDYIRNLCVPFVTLGSDLSFAFCLPEAWQGQTAIVITEPLTAERGFFADKTSLTTPVQTNANRNNSDSYYSQPTYTGMSDLLLKHNYATIVVTFNPDSFVRNIPFFTTEIMGAFAAFVDYAGEPSMTIVTGVGWGGVLAVQLLERHGGCRLHGGLVIDSPLGNARWQGDYYGDILALFEWVSPKAYAAIVATPHNAISHLLLESWEEIGRPYVYQALTPVSAMNEVNNTFTSPRDLKMLEMLRTMNIQCNYNAASDRLDDPHPHCLYFEMTNAIRKAAIYVLSFRLAFKGQDPFDNYRTLYVPEMFPHLNDEVSRKMADEAPLNHQTRFLETSGLLKSALSILTTRRDAEIPGWQTVEYLRKQKQMCDSSGVGSRVINDTVEFYFGHAHTDAFGKELSTQLDILYSMVATMRKVDDSSLTERSWVPAPMKMVDPELASCPFQGYWYRDMAKNIRKSIASGRLKSNGKIQEMIDGFEKVADQTPPNSVEAGSAQAMANAQQKINDVANSAMNGVLAAPASTDKMLAAQGVSVEGATGAVDGAFNKIAGPLGGQGTALTQQS